LIQFLRNLKALIRSSNAVCLISVDEDVLSKYIINSILYLADSVLKITSFKDFTERKIGEYDGTISIIKQPKLHGLIC